jgi:hypothetical protein
MNAIANTKSQTEAQKVDLADSGWNRPNLEPGV